MKFVEAKHQIDLAERKLREVYSEAYQQAKVEIGGNWQDPGVMRRRRERAVEIADEKMKGTQVCVIWGPEKKEVCHVRDSIAGNSSAQ